MELRVWAVVLVDDARERKEIRSLNQHFRCSFLSLRTQLVGTKRYFNEINLGRDHTFCTSWCFVGWLGSS